MASDKKYYLVNPSGTIHVVTREHAETRLKQTGYRLATKTEIAAYEKTKIQSLKTRLAKPWKPELEPETVLPDEGEGEGGKE
ncbi:MAG: hypothetical protein JW953_01515 [Anaerolineae bacterium]|nr:hypothetical protein [Anaerolineae bacterium]